MTTNIGYDSEHPYVEAGADDGEVSLVGDRLMVTRLVHPKPSVTVWDERVRGYVVGVDMPLTVADGEMRLDVAVF